MGDPGSRARRERPGGRSWCLRRVGMDAEWLLLEDGSEVTLGRGFGVTYQLVSKLCPLMISRNHCVLKQNTEGQWTIMDNKVDYSSHEDRREAVQRWKTLTSPCHTVSHYRLPRTKAERVGPSLPPFVHHPQLKYHC